MKSSLSRTNLILAAALVVQIVLLFIVSGDDDGAPGATAKDASIAGHKPFSALETKDVREIIIQNDEGRTLRLQSTMTKEGDKETTAWSLADRDSYPAKTPDVERIIEAVKKIALSRVITRQEKRYAGLKVAEGVAKAHVTLKGEGGRTLADLHVGEGRDFNSIHLRMAGDPAVYQASGPATYDFPTTTGGLVDSAFLDVPVDQVARVKLVHGGDVLEVVKEAPATKPATQPTETAPSTQPAETQPTETKPAAARWVTVGEKPEVLDTTKVEAWIRSLGRVSLAEPVGKTRKPEHGFEQPTSVATLATADGKETVITIGAERKEERDYYATATGKDFVVTVASYNVTDYFQKKVKDLLPSGTTEPGHEGHDHEAEDR